jgi:ribulose-phosphate 3-epimerase
VEQAPLCGTEICTLDLPTTYAADFSKLGGRVVEAGARIFHFDVGDDHFVEDIAIGPVVLRSIAPLVHERQGAMDRHLMVEEPERQFAALKAEGADSVSLHLEACADPAGAMMLAREFIENAASAAAETADFAVCLSIQRGCQASRSCPRDTSG